MAKFVEKQKKMIAALRNAGRSEVLYLYEIQIKYQNNRSLG